MKETVKKVILIAGVCYLGFSAIYWDMQAKDAGEKVEFYEKVMTDFGIDEFVHYPELFYEEGYTEQVKTHNCMWAIDDALECSLELSECKGE